MTSLTLTKDPGKKARKPAASAGENTAGDDAIECRKSLQVPRIALFSGLAAGPIDLRKKRPRQLTELCN
jgi:hypothetical protein